MKKLLVLTSILFLTACEVSNKPPYVKSEFEVDDCQVKYVYHPSMPNFYIARCGNTTTTTWQRSQGKSTITEASININNAEELRNQLIILETRDKALKKLTPEEQKALGLK